MQVEGEHVVDTSLGGLLFLLVSILFPCLPSSGFGPLSLDMGIVEPYVHPAYSYNSSPMVQCDVVAVPPATDSLV